MIRRLPVLAGLAFFLGSMPAHGQGLFDGFGYEYVDDYDYGYYQPQQQWVQPGSPYVVSTVPTVAANTVPYAGPGVTIMLEEDVGGSVTYLVDGRESATIQAGQQQTLSTKGRFEVRFSRGRDADGRDYGEARYTVTEGNYHFVVTDKGWELFRDPGQPDILTTPIQPQSTVTYQTATPPPVVEMQPMPNVIVQPVPQFVPQQFQPPAVDPFMNQGTINQPKVHGPPKQGKKGQP